jgi:hypothetical protein
MKNDDQFEIIEPSFVSMQYRNVNDCRASILGLRISISTSQDLDSIFILSQMFRGGLKVYLQTFGKCIVEMFEQLSGESRKRLVVYCCNGSHCHGDDLESRVYFQFIPGDPLDDKVVVWLKLGRDEEYVMIPDPPSNDSAHWRVIETLG